MPKKQENENREINLSDKIAKKFLFGACFFSIPLILGILAGQKLKNLYSQWMLFPEPISATKFLFYFVVATLFIVWLIYFAKLKKSRRFLLKIIFFLAIFLGSISFFSLWFSDVISFILIIALFFFWFKKQSLFFHDLLLVFAIAGIGARVGIGLKPEAVVLLLAIFSIYDYIAVYKTKHMVKVAEEMVSQKVFLGVIIPGSFSGFKTKLSAVQAGKDFLILGAGDIIFPLIFSVSLLSQGAPDSFIVAIFSFIGLLANFCLLIFQKDRKPIPALPLIATFSIIGYLLIKLAQLIS